MEIVEEVVKYGLPLTAFFVSLCSFLFAKWNWRESNRPIVAAMVRTTSGGSESIRFDLVVINSGNRPATAIRLTADLEDVKACLADQRQASVETVHWRDSVACFSEAGEIPLLLHGKEASNAFGLTKAAGTAGAFWKYGSRFPVAVQYSDLTGRKFTSKQVLVISDTTGFAGGFWRVGTQ